MLTEEEDVEAHALHRRGWSIAAIARHLGRDRKTVRAYLRGERRPGERRRTEPDALAPSVPYVRERLAEDPHLWATALYDEVLALGYERSYVTFARQVRRRELRPVCAPCAARRAHPTIEIAHPPGEEIQWDWLELPGAPWDGAEAHLPVGTLSHSGKFRAAFSESEDQAHLVEAIDAVLRRLGGTARRWRLDRMSTVCEPGSGALLSSFAAVARYYGVGVDICPARRAKRKGAVESRNHFIAQRFWRTLRAVSLAEAQVRLDRFCAGTADGRRRGRGTVADAARAERLAPLPTAPYPATLEAERVVGPSSLVAYQGNRYSIPPGLEGARVTLRRRLGTGELEIRSPAGQTLARHALAPPGAGTLRRLPEHRAALEAAVLGAFTTQRPCPRKANRPPGEAALLAARALGGEAGREVVVDLERYAAYAGGAR